MCKKIYLLFLSFLFLKTCFAVTIDGILNSEYNCMVTLLNKFSLTGYYPSGLICTETFQCGPDQFGIETLPCRYGVGVTCNKTTALIEKFSLFNFNSSFSVSAGYFNCFSNVSYASIYNSKFDDKFLYEVSSINNLKLDKASVSPIVDKINKNIKELYIGLSYNFTSDLSFSNLLDLNSFSIETSSVDSKPLDESNVFISLKNDLNSYKFFKILNVVTNNIPSFNNIGVNQLTIKFGINFNGDFSNFSTFNNISNLFLLQINNPKNKTISYEFPIELNNMNSPKLFTLSISYKLSTPKALIDFSNFDMVFETLLMIDIGNNFYFNNKFPFSKLSPLKSFFWTSSNNLPFLFEDSFDYSIFNGIQFVNLASNRLNGTLPSNYKGKQVKQLNLSNNNLKGTIDNSYCTVLLDASKNQLSDPLPSCYSCYINQIYNNFLNNSNLSLTTQPPCSTVLPQIKIENNNTIIYGQDLGFGLSFISTLLDSNSSVPLSSWKVGTLSKSYYLEKFTKETNFTISFINSPSKYYTLSTIQNPPFISQVEFTTYSTDYKIITLTGSFFTYNTSDISVEFGTGPNRECSIISSDFYYVVCKLLNFNSLGSGGIVSAVVKIISNTNLKIQFPLDIGDANVNSTSTGSLCYYGQLGVNNCNYFNGQGECIAKDTCKCEVGWMGLYCQQQSHRITSVIPSNQYGGLITIIGEFGINHLNIFVTIGNGTISDPEKICEIQSTSQEKVTCLIGPGFGITKLTLGQNNYNVSTSYQFNAVCPGDCNSLVDNTNVCNNLTGICSCNSNKYQGLDCKIPFIPCQDDCNSYLQQGSCNNITGVCTCTNNKWTNGSYCSIPNHFCSSITPAPSGVGGPITLYGWFGNEHNDLMISIGGLPCNYTAVSIDQINCTVASNTGIQTVNITQNQISWIGINKFQYYQIIKPCPNKCSNQGICNQTNGQCNCNNGYSGFDCSATIPTGNSTESNSEPLPITKSEINIETGTFSLNNEETKYKLYIKSLIEVDINNNPVKTFDLQDNMINTDSNDLTGTYLFKQTLSSKNNNNSSGYIISTIQEIKKTKEMNFAGVDFKLESGSIKVSIEINNYTYSSNLNTLQLLFISSVNEESDSNSNKCNDKNTLVQNINDSDLNYIKMEKNGKILMGRFVNSVISDNRPTLITSTNLRGQGSDSDSIIVTLNLPHCINQCQIDPDFSVLVSPSYKSNCDTDSGGRKKWFLPVVIVVPVVCVCIIITTLMAFAKKSLLFRVKMQSIIKLKTRK
ncbi:hypothetical protein RB653_008162 [Dictyostelium firmibasis]|uniref:EGF-like domain-containing protein n=1 Tax=Dictyostelium firmibasis TaxID=79012 RepID=A0AAN7YQX0_9MYCE